MKNPQETAVENPPKVSKGPIFPGPWMPGPLPLWQVQRHHTLIESPRFRHETGERSPSYHCRYGRGSLPPALPHWHCAWLPPTRLLSVYPTSRADATFAEAISVAAPDPGCLSCCAPPPQLSWAKQDTSEPPDAPTASQSEWEKNRCPAGGEAQP